MPHSTIIPLYLFQVLEEECISLHENAFKSETLTIELPDPNKPNQTRSVTAKLDWQFHQSHIKDPGRLAADLLMYAEPEGMELHDTQPNVQTSDWVKDNLTNYLRPKVNKSNLETLRDLQDKGRDLQDVGGDLLRTLTDELNEILKDEDLYRADRFSSNWLSPATGSLIALSASSKGFKGDDLAHFNRLLLEDAFPESLEKIHDIRLAAMYHRLHLAEPKALCLSGGGIRSGTFGLGILQGLARHKLLGTFDYLSTVSGGGYIGSWLTAWIHRHPQGLNGVMADLANENPRTKIDPEPAPLLYLRSYSNFITPKVGLLTADTWTFLGIYLRNLFLNWLVFIPLLLAVLMLPRLIVTVTLAQPEPRFRKHLVFSLGGLDFDLYGRHLFLLLGFLLGVWALAYVVFNRPGIREELRQRSPFWRSRSSQRGFLSYCLLPLIGSAFFLTTYWAWSSENLGVKPFFWFLIFLIFGAVFSFVAWLTASLVLRRVLTPRNWKDINWFEMIALMIAGVTGGALLWLISRLGSFGANPVIGYTDIGNGEFPWTSWSSGTAWTWITWTSELYACLAVPVFALVFLGGATIFVGISSVSPKVEDEDREWWARFGAWVLIAIIAWTAATTLVIFGPIALLTAPKILVSVGGLSGLLAILLGRSSKTAATEESAHQKKAGKTGVVASLLSRSLPLMAVIFMAAFLAALSLATTGIFQGVALLANRNRNSNLEWLTNIPAPGFPKYLEYIHAKGSAPDWFTGAKIVHMNVLHHSSTWFVLSLGILFFFFGMRLSKWINLNLFSLHAGYRNRLIRAFLGASRPDHERKANPFTGFDPADNLAMHELRPALLDEDDFLDPLALIAQLLDKDHELSRYLTEQQLLNNVNSLPNTTSPSPRLVAALRKDLNAALQDEGLYKQTQVIGFLQTKNAKPIQDMIKAEQRKKVSPEVSSRSENHILLNRAILEMAYPNMIRPRPLKASSYKLMPVINTTLNLVGGDNLAWQQRKAEPFSVTPLHSGCYRVGYRDSKEYGGAKTGGISVGTAAAISGAAASSNMGYYTTSPVLSLLLTLFNVRLGWWLGNPGPAGAETFRLRAPKYSVKPVIDEALGLTDDRNKYVYLTDGGHFENLAIYEMVLRRCHVIVVSDGAQDEDYRFTDLGNAIRKIRIDLGVPIEFGHVPIYAGWPEVEKKGLYWAIGKIRYKCIDGPNAKDGLLLYIKPALYGTEPRDVLEYKKSNPSFPHQTTADQFFDEPQFESYRILGSHIMDQLCDVKPPSPVDLFKMIKNAAKKLEEGSEPVDQNFKDWVDDWLLQDQ